MKLIYIYIEKFRNIQRQCVSFTSSYRVEVIRKEDTADKAEGIHITRGEDDKNYQPNVYSIHAIVGRNASGKTNIADIIGMPWDLRNSTEESAYFLLYVAEDSSGKDIYYAEIVGLDHFLGIFEDIANPNHRLCDSWFQHDPDNYRLKELKRTELDSKITKSRAAILSLREKFSQQHYFKVEENKYSFSGGHIKRVGHPYASRNISDQVQAFWRIATNKSFMQGKSQLLSVRCCMDYLNCGPGGAPPLFEIEYAEGLKRTEYLHLRIVETWIKSLLEKEVYQDGDRRDDLIRYIKTVLSKRPRKEADNQRETSYYRKLLRKYMDIAFERMVTLANWSSEHTGELERRFDRFLNFPLYSCREDGFDLLIGNVSYLEKEKSGLEEGEKRKTGKKILIDFLEDIFDSGWAESGGFSNPIWTDTSDGEQSFLHTFTAIEKVLNDPNAKCQSNILLMDEPEIHMHPDLSRCFVNELLKWLRMHRGNRRYQIILITHSPFLLSDIERHNVQYVEKRKDGLTRIQRPKSQTFAANIHDILSDAIILDSPYGEFARQEIKTALKSLKTLQEEVANKTAIKDIDKKAVKETLQKLSDTVGEQIVAKQLGTLSESI